MNKFKLSLFFLLLTLILPAAEGIDLTGYSDAGSKIVFNQNFDGIKKWRRLPGYTLAKSEGANGTTALKLDRRRESPVMIDYSAVLPKLTPGARYEVSFSVKSADVKRISGNSRMTVGGIEFTKNGNTVKRDFPTYVPSGDYTQIKFSFFAPADMDAQLTLGLNHEFAGLIWYDDITVQATGVDYSSRVLYPYNLTFRSGDSRFKLHINDGTPANLRVLVRIEQNGKKEEMLLEPQKLDGKFRDLAVGEGKLSIFILDTEKKRILAVNEYKVNVLPPDEKAPANSVMPDEHGRMIVNGKPFMPFGVYGLFHEANLKRISETGFNCVLVYPSLYMYADKKSGDRIADIRAALDRFSKYDLKIIFALNQQFPGYHGLTELGDSTGLLGVAERAAREFKDHPALMGWYVSDEVSRHTIPYVQNLREALNRIDPWHPAYTITYRMQDMPLYGVSGDVIGVDPYPIKAVPVKPALDDIVTYMKGAQSTGMPIWAIPQIFNWAVTDPQMKKNPAAFAKTRGPNGKEMRAMPLLCAIMGAKGFIFFAEHSITLTAEMIIPGTADKVWRDVADMAKEIKRLEPYILSIAAAPEVKVTGSDRVMAKAFKSEDGKTAVFIVALGPDAAQAEITLDLPAGTELESRFGLTAGKNGKYIFKANGIDSDILEEK